MELGVCVCEGRTYGVGRVCVCVRDGRMELGVCVCVCEGRTYGVGRVCVCVRDGRMELGVCV